jgi:hypothetical protein
MCLKVPEIRSPLSNTTPTILLTGQPYICQTDQRGPVLLQILEGTTILCPADFLEQMGPCSVGVVDIRPSHPRR